MSFVTDTLKKYMEPTNKGKVFNKLSANKLKPISDEILAKLFLSMVQELQDTYGEDAITHPKIDEAEEMVNVVWAQCNQGKASLIDFQEVLAGFKRTYSDITQK